MRQSLLRLLPRCGRSIREAWLIAGIVLVLGASLEIAYRTIGLLRRTVSGSIVPPSHPLYGQRWFVDYLDEDRASEGLRWKPYVYYRRAAFRGRYIHVDSLGHRYTVQQALNHGQRPVRRVWLFGGSTMWGTYQRESATIPATTALKLHELGIDNVEVTNFGEAGYVMTQEVLELLLQLREGSRPDVVVFYDGINDAAAVVQNGQAGLPQNESNRAREFRIGRALFSWRHDLQTELRAAATLAGLSTSRLLLMHRLQGVVTPPWQAAPPERLTRELLTSYVSTVQVVECLSQAYGFKVLYLWQPSLHATHKPLTPFERGLMREIDADPFEADLKAVHLRTSQSIDSAMAGIAPGRFLNLSDVLSKQSRTIFADGLGHTIEDANPLIVDAFIPVLRQLVAPSSQTSQSAVSRAPAAAPRGVKAN